MVMPLQSTDRAPTDGGRGRRWSRLGFCGMARLDFPTYLQHIRDESQRFRDVLADCDPTAAVPSCPDWRADDLLWHLGEVQHFWTWMVTNRPKGPDEYDAPARPGDHAGLLAFYDEHYVALVDALAGAEPTDEAWTWSQEHTVGFILRRQAHEALIHRRDEPGISPARGADDPRWSDGGGSPTPARSAHLRVHLG